MLNQFIDILDGIIWSPPLVFSLLITGIIFSIITRFVQIRQFKEMIRLLFKGEKSPQGISSFQAISLSLAGRVGTGNIVGVSSAIFIGGPGAVFWMWVTALLGASTAFVESTLGQIYKQKENGEYRGGPAFYIENGIGGKFGKVFALIFAFTTIISIGLLMPGVQSNAIATSLHSAFNIPKWIVTIFLVILLSLIVFGGIKRIANIATAVVPFMAIAYIILAIIVILLNFSQVPGLITLIFKSALGLHSTFGGIVGSMIQIGVKRGLYSNEAGQGTGPHAAAAAEVSHPAKQGLVQAFSAYVDTLFVCTATALIILISGTYNTTDGTQNADGHPHLIENNHIYVINSDGTHDSSGTAMYVQSGIDKAFQGEHYHFDPNISGFGSYFIAIALFFFAFTTILAYSYITETNAAFLTKNMSKKSSKVYIFFTRLILVFATAYGTIKTANTAWAMGDLGVGIMAWLNIVAIWILFKPAFSALRDFERQKKEKKSGNLAVYKTTPENTPNATFWFSKNE
jgi:AGCS family alanine or glycine:cation symporter